MPQNKISILSTRLLDDEFIRDAQSENLSIDAVSFIQTESISFDPLPTKIQEALGAPTTIVFTSANAVEAIAPEIKDQAQWKIFCMGYGTRRSVEKYFGERSIAGVANNAKELAEAIFRVNVAEVIFFCGDQRRDELPNQLKKNNIEITEIEVYKTILTPRKIEKKYDGILFFSPSAVKSFFQLNDVPDQTVLFAIGNTTADEIKGFSKNKTVVSDEPEKKILIEKVIHHFQTFTHH